MQVGGRKVTLILSYLSRGFVLQVSDRLVTAPGAIPFDGLANKNIIYQARDAIVSMSYTGPAFIGQVPTDNWIAQKLTGVDVSKNFGTRMGPLPKWYDIGQATRLLAEEFQSSEIARTNSYFELVVVGWQWKITGRPPVGRHQPVPMAWGLSKPQGGGFESEVERLPRRWYWRNRTFCCASPRSNLPKDKRASMFDRLRAELNPAPALNVKIADKVEQAAVDTIRSVAKENRYVGPNCMSVVIAPPHQSALVRVTFFPYEQHTAQLVRETIEPITGPAAFSPWVIGAKTMQMPSVAMGKGGYDIQMGPFAVRLNGPDSSPQGLLWALSSQRRPTRPR
jgi:hypothetical protein